MFRCKGKLSHKRYFGDKAFVLRLIHRIAKKHNQSRHQKENRQETQHNCPDQAKRHIAADAELHKHHGNQPAYRSQRTGRYLRYGFA